MGFWERLMGEEPGIFDTLFNYENKGQFGEYATEFALTNNNISGYSKAFHNVYLPIRSGTTEIDVLMVHECGIYVFESKNYSGWIFGSEEQQNWMQCLWNKEKHQFYNPIKQNKTHCKALAAFLDVPQEQITSYIIFSNRCELKKVPENTQRCKIMRREDLLRILRRELDECQPIYSRAEVDEICARLSEQTNVSCEKKEQHVADIKNRTEGSVCPFCGGKLVERSGKYGKFYGCTNYPKCKFTRKIARED